MKVVSIVNLLSGTLPVAPLLENTVAFDEHAWYVLYDSTVGWQRLPFAQPEPAPVRAQTFDEWLAKSAQVLEESKRRRE